MTEKFRPIGDLPRKLTSTLNIALATAAVVVIYALNATALYRSVETIDAANRLVVHTQQVIDELDQVQALARDAESAQRGFAISGDNRFLEPYTNARQRLPERLTRVRILTADNSIQQLAATDMTDRALAVMGFADKAVNMRRNQGIEAVTALISSGEGKLLMDRLSLKLSEMKATELDLLANRNASTQSARESAYRAFWIQTAVNVFLALIAAYLVNRTIQTQAKDRDRLAREAWLKSAAAELAAMLRGDLSPADVARRTLDFFSATVGAQVGSFYARELGRFRRLGGLGLTSSEALQAFVEGGDTLLASTVRHNKVTILNDLPDNFLKVATSIGEAQPRATALLPVECEGDVNGIVEVATLSHFDARSLDLFDAVRDVIGISLNAAMSRARLQDLLEETQRQAEELQAQQEELRVSNEELEAQTHALKASQDRLQVQQEALRQTNEELEQQAQAVEAQRGALADRNAALEDAQEELRRRSEALARASRYKSEFLANMSHELRTPLNSLLILATLLYENKEATLSEKQIGFARTIYRAGNDLLTLINDILDLSKVEAGKMDLNVEQVDLEAILRGLDQTFRPLAEQKNLKLVLRIADDAPRTIQTDSQRLEQILKNLVSNAVKFTDQGTVEIALAKAALPQAISISVKDSGIGIPQDKQRKVFEAFEQVDSSTSRAYGGTGLGLTISRELTRLLGGMIGLDSEPGKGSTFTLSLPRATPERPAAPLAALAAEGTRTDVRAAVVHPSAVPVPTTGNFDPVEGDTAPLAPGENLVLVVEDDKDFGHSLLEVARESGFKAVLATSGEAGLDFARKHPVSAILLDIQLPDVSGLSVLESLKRSGETRHVPIHIISGVDHSQNALKLGAMGYLVKPAEKAQLQTVFRRLEHVLSRQVKKVLIVEDDKMQREAIKQLLGNGDVELDTAESAREALSLLKSEVYDCMVLDLRLPDMSGFELLEHLGRADLPMRPPVVVYTGQDLSKAEQERLARYADSIIVKGARSPERLLDEVSLFLHRLETRFPEDSQAILKRLRTQDKTLAGRKILLVDDDMRNVFALVNALDAHDMKSVVARNGKEALSQLDKDAGIELVLMDIMMPVMDGYEAITQIRKDGRFKKLPIIALTAKAMKGDQERCLAAGANDYLPKPVNLERLTSLLKVWLPRRYE